MAILQHLYLLFLPLLTLFLFLFLLRARNLCNKNTAIPTNWPLFGMLPAILWNRHRIHAFANDILTESGGTFHLKGPWFCNLDMLVTSHPANIHHIFSRNFSNYPKGPEFQKIFEILGDGIFNADFHLWELHRKTTLSFLSHDTFYRLLEMSVSEKIRMGLIPVLDMFCRQGDDVDLQEVFQRFMFDSICKLILNHDPNSLTVEFLNIPCEKAFNDTMEALLHRHLLPELVWKLQKWLKIGKEGKLIRAWKSFDEFIYQCLDSDSKSTSEFGLLSSFKKVYKSDSKEDTRVFLRDTALNLLIAGRDTSSTCLTWLFWLIAKNPHAEARIREEMESQLPSSSSSPSISVDDTRKLVYLHGALCESLRLFPPVALEHKSPIQGEVLPTGDYVGREEKVILTFYSTGRMAEVWGKDCLEFRPERWITARGGVKHEASYKFPAFNAGPRTCLGKEMAFVQMKMVAAAVLQRYNLELVEDHPVEPLDSIILQAKYGLRVKLLKI